MITENRNGSSANRAGGFLCAAVLGVLVFGPMDVYADTVPRLSENKFNEAVVDMTGEYDRKVTQAQAERNPFINRRLILNSSDPYVDPDDYNAVEAIQDKHGNYILQFKTYAAARRAEAYLAKDEATNYVEPDYPLFAAETNMEDIEDADSDRFEAAASGGLTNSGSGSLSAAADYSWDLSMMGLDTYADKVSSSAGSSSAVVAVLDSGISFSHELLSSRILSGKAASFVSGCNVDEDQQSGNKMGHGTHVAGIIARCTSGLNVSILPIRILDSSGAGSVSTLISGINYAVSSGADVINLSLGGAIGERSAAVEECIERAVNNNVAVVAAAGNGGKNISAEYVTPAYISDCIVVGAVDSSKDRANSSNYGETVDVAAPGVSIYSSYITSSGVKTYTSMSGTSMAAPHVSAEAAMLRMMNRSYSARQIEALIQKQVIDLGSSGKDDYYGYGLACLTRTVTFAPGTHGTFSAVSKSVVYQDATPSAPSVTCESGYAFAGWTPALSSSVTEDVTYTAAYKATVTEAVTNTIQLINAIGTVTYSDSSKAAIDAARAAYNALDSDHQSLVTNLSTLSAAESSYAALAAGSSSDTASQTVEAVQATGTTQSTEAAQTAAAASTAAQAAAIQEPITITKIPSGFKAKAKRNKVTLSWKKIKSTKKTKKLLGQIKAIQIQYSTDPTFTQNVVNKRISKSKSKVTLKLKKKTAYYVRIRYVGSDGVSAWTGIKKVRTK